MVAPLSILSALLASSVIPCLALLPYSLVLALTWTQQLFESSEIIPKTCPASLTAFLSFSYIASILWLMFTFITALGYPSLSKAFSITFLSMSFILNTALTGFGAGFIVVPEIAQTFISWPELMIDSNCSSSLIARVALAGVGSHGIFLAWFLSTCLISLLRRCCSFCGCCERESLRLRDERVAVAEAIERRKRQSVKAE